MFNPDADGPHILSKARKIDLAKGPNPKRKFTLMAVIETVKAAFRLIAAAVVVDDGFDACAKPGSAFPLVEWQ